MRVKGDAEHALLLAARHALTHGQLSRHFEAGSAPVATHFKILLRGGRGVLRQVEVTDLLVMARDCAARHVESFVAVVIAGRI